MGGFAGRAIGVTGSVRDYLRGLRSSVLNNSAAYGYSVTITATFAVLNVSLGSASVFDVFAFAFGAIAAFSLIDVVATGGFRKRLRGDPPEVVVLGSAIGFLSAGTGVGSAALLADLVGTDVAWALGSLAATALYVIVLAGELMLAARIDPAKARERD